MSSIGSLRRGITDELFQAMKSTMPKTGEDDDILDDSDVDEDDDDDMPSDMDSEGGLSLAEDSGDEDLMDMPEDGLIEYDGSDSDGDDDGGEGEEEEEWGGIGGGGAGGKRKREEKDEKKANKKKRKALPTFASYEDYAKMIDDGPEDDI